MIVFSIIHLFFCIWSYGIAYADSRSFSSISESRKFALKVSWAGMISLAAALAFADWDKHGIKFIK